MCIATENVPYRTPTFFAGARECRGSRELGILGHVQYARCKAHGEQQNSPGARESARDLVENSRNLRCGVKHGTVPFQYFEQKGATLSQ